MDSQNVPLCNRNKHIYRYKNGFGKAAKSEKTDHSTGCATAVTQQHTGQRHRDRLQLYSAHKDTSAAHSYREKHDNVGKQ